jgi:hypothetical protein
VVVNIALWLWILAAGVLALVLFEVVLRMQFGLGTPPLYVVDARTGYRLAPNQRLRRRGNRIETNQYSMRGGPNSNLSPSPIPCVFCCWEIPSSMAGGGQINQTRILSQVMQAALANVSELPYKPVRSAECFGQLLGTPQRAGLCAQVWHL